MRTQEELIAATKMVTIAGQYYDEPESFEDKPCVVLPEMTADEQDAHYDNLVTYWCDRDYMYVFDHDETIAGYEADNFRVTAHSEVK